MKRIFGSICIAGFALLALNAEVHARPNRPGLIPNGFNVPNANADACLTCHIGGGGGPRNAFGLDVEPLVTSPTSPFWGPALAALDSDGDGFSNGQELQDPEGAWQPGDPDPGDAALVTNPGDSNSHPGQVGGQPDAWLARLEGEEVATEGRGTAFFILDEDNLTLQYYINVFSLENVTNSHIHISTDGSVVYPLEIPTDGSSSGSLTITAQDLENMRNGMYYVNVHTEQNPGGEIRGTMADEPLLFEVELSGDEEVPPVETAAHGEFIFTLSEDLMTLNYELEVEDIQNVTMAHIHEAPVGVSGDVVFPLSTEPFEEEITGEIALTEEQLMTLLSELYYVNVHTDQNPTGEIRGQLQLAEEPVSAVHDWMELR